MFNPLSVNHLGYMNIDEDASQRRVAIRLFEKALRQAWKKRLLGTFRSHSQKVALLADFRKECALRESRSLGLQQVNINEIQGSEGRATEFDIDFNPILERTENRWVSIAIARLIGRPLPPVELLRFGNFYFVRDGHHRISVARAFGESMIEAEVIEMEGDSDFCTL